MSPLRDLVLVGRGCSVRPSFWKADGRNAEYIDLFLIHDAYSGHERRLQTYRALLEARDLGKIRSVGVSN
jgi:aryl-alcohol dehydrogenase-like predicted oxidoreductase